MQVADIEQKVIAYLTLPKNKVSPWCRICKDVGNPDAQATEILRDLCERNILETQTISLGRIVVSLTDNYSGRVGSNSLINRGFSGNIIGNNFSGNTIIFGHDNKASDNSFKQNNINLIPLTNNKSTFWKFVSRYWWALIIPIDAGIILLLIEYNYFVR